MKTFKYGESLKGAKIGDTVINFFGEKLVIEREIGSVWIVRNERGQYPRPVFKYNPNHVPIVGME